MPIIYQKRIYREDCRANPHLLYVFGDNVERYGYGGQAREMRGEPNAIGVATKRYPGTLTPDFFSDDDYAVCCEIIADDLKPIRRALTTGVTVVLPLDGLGTGLSMLPEKAPRVNDYLKRELDVLAHIL